MALASDPGQASAEQAEQFLGLLAETGKIAKLPVLNAAELHALGALTGPLLDELALRWQQAQPDPETAARRGYEHLVQRRMIDPADGRVCPELGLILAGRTRPAFIAVLRERPDSSGTLPSRFLGIADEEVGLRAVLMETAPPVITRDCEGTGPLYVYELSAPAKSTQTIAGFAAQAKNLVIDFYQPGTETSLPSQRFTVTRGRRKLRVEWRTPHTSPQQRSCSQDDLAGLLLDTMIGACR